MGNLTVEIVFQIIANKNIATRCKCRSYLNREQIGNNVTWKTENPMVFYYGNFVAKEYEIAGETKREIEGVWYPKYHLGTMRWMTRKQAKMFRVGIGIRKEEIENKK